MEDRGKKNSKGIEIVMLCFLNFKFFKEIYKRKAIFLFLNRIWKACMNRPLKSVPSAALCGTLNFMTSHT